MVAGGGQGFRLQAPGSRKSSSCNPLNPSAAHHAVAFQSTAARPGDRARFGTSLHRTGERMADGGNKLARLPGAESLVGVFGHRAAARAMPGNAANLLDGE